MGFARYLLRLDDACPTAEWERWDALEEILDEHAVRPIVAVIPDNRQPDFRGAPRPDFWEHVRAWQAKGWTIGMHGLDHVYVTDRGGLVPINRFSEFAGLPLDDQRGRIRRAWEILRDHGVRPDVWIAPGHSFDENTLEALRSETDLRTISDGIALGPFREHGFDWLPQQLWSFRRMPFGTWTICLHPNTLETVELDRLETALAGGRRFIAFEDVRWRGRRRGLADRLFARAFFYRLARRRAP